MRADSTFQSKRGITLIEAIVYVALLGLVLVVVVNFMLQIGSVYQQARAEREVLSNARLLHETVTKAIAQANEIYQPTSRFQTNSGQLSLITQLGAQPEHATAYQDFWVDNGRLWMRREGQGEIPLSAPSVRVNRFYLEWILQGLDRQSVRMTLQVDSANPRFPSSITLNSTTAVRGNY